MNNNLSVKKSFDREKMYKKIMPSYAENDGSVDEEDVVQTPTIESADLSELADCSAEAYLNNSEIQKLNNNSNGIAICNITEKIVLRKLEMVLENMGCCKCERCKMDIIALAMNQLPQHYVVDSSNAFEYKADASPVNQEVTSVLLKSALTVRKNPRH